MNMRDIYNATRRAYRSAWANSAAVDCRTLVNCTSALRTVTGRWDTCTPDRTSYHAPWQDHRTGRWNHRPLLVTNACYWFCLKTDDSGARKTLKLSGTMVVLDVNNAGQPSIGGGDL